MKKEELRIGNYVAKGVGFVEESPITLDYLFLMEKHNLPTRGIPLTEDWLIKFGFEENPDGSFIITIEKNWTYLIVEEDFSYGCSDSDDLRDAKKNYVPLAKLKYVHQLQNLYYSLVGQELKIK